MKALLNVAFATTLTLANCAPAAAQANTNCAPHAVVVERLAENFGETRQSIALDSAGSVVEVFANLETGTWTFTVTRPGAPTCLVGNGVAYQFLNEELPNTDTPA